MSNAISTFILGSTLHAALNHVDKAGLIKLLAEDIDKLADRNLSGRSERFQEDMVKTLLLPLAKELLKENPDAYKEMLLRECEPFRFEREDDAKGVRGERPKAHTPSQNFTVRRIPNDNAN